MVRFAQFNHSETPPPSIWGEKGDQLKVPGEYETAPIFKHGELNIVPWYNGSWKWLLRPVNAYAAVKMAEYAEEAARNPKIGYSQTNDRLSFHQELEDAISPHFINYPCNGDCSSGWAAMSNKAGIKVDPNSWTGSMLQEAAASGGYLISDSAEFLAGPEYLIEGDVLLRPATSEAGGHTVTVIDHGIQMREEYFANALVSPGRWNLRYSPSINGSIITELSGGETMEVMLPCIQQGNYYWYYVALPGRNISGFISRPAITQTKKVNILWDTWLRDMPSLSGERIVVVRAESYVLYNGYSKVDSRGVAWYRVAYANRWGYISSKNCEVVRW